MLVRPAATGGAEVFTFRRRPSLTFAAGMVVFPGGGREPGPEVEAARPARLSPSPGGSSGAAS
jgi:8-oxo-dGTP pyrophosphatase MutT (NUDIX family)